MVGVRQASLFDVPGMFGKHTYPSGSPWTRQMIGIWQDVYLRALPALRVDDIAVRPLVDEGVLEVEVTIRNSTGTAMIFNSRRRNMCRGFSRPARMYFLRRNQNGRSARAFFL